MTATVTNNNATVMQPLSVHTSSTSQPATGRKRKPSTKAAEAAQIPFLKGEDAPRPPPREVPSVPAPQRKKTVTVMAPPLNKRPLVQQVEEAEEYDETHERKRILGMISKYKTVITPDAPKLIKTTKLPSRGRKKKASPKALKKAPAPIETTIFPAATQAFVSSPEFLEAPESFVSVSDEFLSCSDLSSEDDEFMLAPEECGLDSPTLENTEEEKYWSLVDGAAMDDLFDGQVQPEEEMAAAIVDLPPAEAPEEAPKRKRAKVERSVSPTGTAGPYSLSEQRPSSGSLLQPKKLSLSLQPTRAGSIPYVAQTARAVHGGDRLRAHVGFAANLSAVLGASIAAK